MVGTAEALEVLLEHHLSPDIVARWPAEAVDPDEFRRERLYHEDTDAVLRSHKDPLAVVFEIYGSNNPVAGKPNFGLLEWFQLFKDVGMSEGPLAEMTQRDLRLALAGQLGVHHAPVRDRSVVRALAVPHEADTFCRSQHPRL